MEAAKAGRGRLLSGDRHGRKIQISRRKKMNAMRSLLKKVVGAAGLIGLLFGATQPASAEEPAGHWECSCPPEYSLVGNPPDVVCVCDYDPTDVRPAKCVWVSDPTPEPTETPGSTPEPTETPGSTPEPTETPGSTPEPSASPTSFPLPETGGGGASPSNFLADVAKAIALVLVAVFGLPRALRLARAIRRR
ncbi:hypothetical protein A3E44_04840 [Candidatus Woesebacteria bacterium RIFCSPHIGHO2_12_FULL_41_24]|uniref:Gram-positive cocci surface proteins LPxTG domain-containing protein n=1 Tax=Candidatus Woesebacteria bacterium RIFCSPHIGHO2_12_FULL_41_24 TaxID=1802510 RepID=A0A1F8AUX5_9BACT|nr:MAG: hypothetical protein A3E44_04840 [Candidatus Woesebacteria bacterium RIFCSPHIGHO2_12_FULL_41_24]